MFLCGLISYITRMAVFPSPLLPLRSLSVRHLAQRKQKLLMELNSWRIFSLERMYPGELCGIDLSKPKNMKASLSQDTQVAFELWYPCYLIGIACAARSPYFEQRPLP